MAIKQPLVLLVDDEEDLCLLMQMTLARMGIKTHLAYRVEQAKKFFTEFQYDPEFSTVVTPLSEVLAHKRGVCQDFAQLAISCLRCVGIPARYVSGYLETRPPEGQPRLVGADASHAWFAVFEPTLGWIDFDPTNNILADEQHLTLAWGRDYADVVPLKGILHGNGGHQLSVAVDVVPLAD